MLRSGLTSAGAQTSYWLIRGRSPHAKGSPPLPPMSRDQRPYQLTGSWHLPGGPEVATMPGLSKRESRGEAADVFHRLDRMFDEWMRMMPFRPVSFPHWWGAGDLIRVEEYRMTARW